MSDKKSNEQLCLDKVIRSKKLLHGESKKIITKISGSEFERKDMERPDFVRYLPPASKHERGILIGIEHFRVDRLSLQKKNGKVASTGIEIEKNFHRIYEHWYEEVRRSEVIPDDAISDIANLIALQIEKEEKSSYNTFLKSFQYSLDKHLENVDAYRTNLRKLSGGKYNTELALLIEIHSEFRNLFLNDPKGIYRPKNDFTPIFEDMIRLLEEKVNCHKVNYIILCMGRTLHTENPTVVGIRTGDIRKQLEKQKIIIYEYAGKDLIFSDFQAVQRNITVEPSYSISGDKISFGINYLDKDRNEQFIINPIFYALKQALEYRRQGKNFVTTFETQMLLDVLGNYIIGWEKKDSEKILFPVFIPFTREDLLYKIQEFEKIFYEGSREKL